VEERVPKRRDRNLQWTQLHKPYALKNARTVSSGGKPERAYLSQLGHQVNFRCELYGLKNRNGVEGILLNILQPPVVAHRVEYTLNTQRVRAKAIWP
jgi:hypothetical protein